MHDSVELNSSHRPEEQLSAKWTWKLCNNIVESAHIHRMREKADSIAQLSPLVQKRVQEVLSQSPENEIPQSLHDWKEAVFPEPTEIDTLIHHLENRRA